MDIFQIVNPSPEIPHFLDPKNKFSDDSELSSDTFFFFLRLTRAHISALLRGYRVRYDQAVDQRSERTNDCAGTTSYGCGSLVENRGNESHVSSSSLSLSLSLSLHSSTYPAPFLCLHFDLVSCCNVGCYNAFGLVVGRKCTDQFDPSKYCTVALLEASLSIGSIVRGDTRETGPLCTYNNCTYVHPLLER